MPEVKTPYDTLHRFAGPAWFGRLADWIRRHRRGLLAAGVFFQLAILAAMIVIHATPFIFGDRILLNVLPVDPRDMFRGDYVVLTYDFSRLPPGGIQGLSIPSRWQSRSQDSWLEDRTVYVSLVPEPDGKHYRGGEVSVHRPTTGRYLKGRFARSSDGNDLRFGIEAFYVEEGQGLALERLRNTSQLTAEIALTPWGQAALCGVK